jgi:hypothetical protein
MNEDPASPIAKTAGCLAALLFGGILAFPFLFGMFWGGSHCAPVPECQRAGEWAFLGKLAIIVPAAALFGFSVRALVHWAVQRSQLGREASGPPLWALTAALLLIAGVIVYFQSL